MDDLPFQIGTVVEVCNPSNDTWQQATVEDIDSVEKEVLVAFADGNGQEWLYIDKNIRLKEDGNAVIKKKEVDDDDDDDYSNLIGNFPLCENISTADSDTNLGDEGENFDNECQVEVESSAESIEEKPLELKASKPKASFFRVKLKGKVVLDKKFEKTEEGDDDVPREEQQPIQEEKADESVPDSVGSFDDTVYKLTKKKGRRGRKGKRGKNDHTKPYNIRGRDGEHRASIVVNDERLPLGWSKHVVKRKGLGNKWDVILMNSDGRKFRCKADLRSYLANCNADYNEDDFDFILPNKNNVINEGKARKQSSATPCETISPVPSVSSDPLVLPAGQKRIKMLMPKRPSVSARIPHEKDTSGTFPAAPLSNSFASTSAAESPFLTPKVPSVVKKDGPGFYCPKLDCRKLFRSENLMMMHIKHYHKEYQNMLTNIPAVADFAHARTIGEKIDAYSDCLETITRIEEGKMTSAAGVISDRDLHQLICLNQLPMQEGLLTPKMESTETESSVLLAQLKEPPLMPAKLNMQPGDDVYVLQQQQQQHRQQRKEFDRKESGVVKIKKEPFASHILTQKEGATSKKAESGKNKHGALKKQEVVNCVCGSGDEVGFMIQCEFCLCWQHGLCAGVENEFVQGYVCAMCQNPKKLRSSQKYAYMQNWLANSNVPTFPGVPANSSQLSAKEEYLKENLRVTSDLYKLKNVMRGLNWKINIASIPNHPKLYYWSDSWVNKNDVKPDLAVPSTSDGPVPAEAPIDTKVCLKNLWEHIDAELDKVLAMVLKIQAKMEDMDMMEDYDDVAMKQTMNKLWKKLMKDLKVLSEAKELNIPHS